MAERPTLAGVDLKVERAKEHRIALETEFGELLRVGAGDVVGEFDPDLPGYRYRLVGAQPIPPTWGIVAAEVLFNLRSALDHLAYQLALLHSGDGFTDTMRANSQFTLGTDSDTRFKELAGKHLRGVAPGHWALIERLQPYHSGDVPPPAFWGNSKPPVYLDFLNELHRREKHRSLLIVWLSVQSVGYTPPCRPGGYDFTGGSEGDTEIGQCRCVGEPHMGMQPRFVVEPAIQGGPPSYNLIDALDVLTRNVEIVIAAFRTDFPV